MAPSKEWMTAPRSSTEYLKGVEEFLEFLRANKQKLGGDDWFCCPCIKCHNIVGGKKTLRDIRKHLIDDGIDASYTTWIHHGEIHPPSRVNDGAINHDEDAFPITIDVQAQDNSPKNIQNKKLMEDAMQPPNPSSRIEDTKLSVTDELLNIKAEHKWSDKSFNELLQLIKEVLPEKNTSLRREIEELKLAFSKSGTQMQSSTYHGSSSQDDSLCKEACTD